MARGRFNILFLLALAIGVVVLVAAAVRTQDVSVVADGATTQPVAESAEPTTTPSIRAVPVSLRGGLPNVAAKLKDKKDITVVFLGGGVTASGGGRNYSEQVGYWLRSQYRASHIRVVNVGILHTNTNFGVARFDRDVLSVKPDLVVIDFAADNAVSGERVLSAPTVTLDTERMIRKAWNADPAMDILLLYTFAEGDRTTWKQGLLPVSAAAQDRVAAHYQLPSIALGVPMSKAVEASGSALNQYLIDEIVPTPRGHELYGDFIDAHMPDLLKSGSAGSRNLIEVKPIAKNFYLYPTTLKARPEGTAPPMVLVDGSKAKQTWDMPIVSVHWVGTPEFFDSSVQPKPGEQAPVLWYLRTQGVRENGRRLNDVFSLDRSKWGPPMQWFEEFRCFAGPAGLPLIETGDRQSTLIDARNNDLPIIGFVAPKAGRYVLSMRAKQNIWWGDADAIAMNVVVFKKGENRGTSVGFHRSENGLLHKPEIASEVQLESGDEITFCVDTNSATAGSGVGYLGAQITIGYFGAK